jgi:Carboxypeptidase regulatory-like domain/TonB dependent receptor-like, beta-barrel
MVVRRNSGKFVVSLLALGGLALSLLISVRVSAQVTGATLSGTVTDASGAAIPNSQLSIRNVSTGVVRSVVTDGDGFYTAPNLLPGSYDVTVTASGFKTGVRSGITLTVGAQQVLNITLQVGQATQRVEVTGAAPAVQLASSSIGAVVSSNTVVELPLNGRSWADLATLSPAVNVVQTQFSNASFTAPKGNRGFGNQLTIAGTRPQLNNYRLDGISIVDYSEGSPGSILGITLGVDAVGEFSVLTSNYSAEYGRTSGGVVNAITRSGTNQLHGDAYWFLRDEDFDAATFVDNLAGRSVPPFHRNQFGVSAGGPIQKDKTFFFANYEGFREALGTTFVNKVPSADARSGIIHNADGTTCTIGVVTSGCSLTNSSGTVGVDPKVAPYLGLWPLPNAGLIGVGNTGHFDDATNTNDSENFVTSRIDRKFSDKNSLSGTFFYDKATRTAPDALLTVLNGNISLREMFTVEETHIFSPTLVNSLRVGYSRIHPTQNQPIKAILPLAGDSSGVVSPLPGRYAPALTVPGLTTFLGGLGEASVNNQPWNSYQLYDDAFLTKGVHALKFGFAFENMRHAPSNRTYFDSSFFWGGLTQLLTDQPNSLRLPGQFFQPGVRQSLFGGYIQDDWKARPNLTLNLGLRYEAVTVPAEEHNRLSNLHSFTDPGPTLGAPYLMNPTLRNFEPRVGFAWDPFHDGKTAVRGAFGMFDVLPLDAEFFTAMSSVAPYSTSIQVNVSKPTADCPSCGPGSFPGIAQTLLLAGAGSTFSYALFQFNPPRNYVMVWNLNVQHQITPSTALTLGYVGNHGVHMFNRTDDANMVLPMANTPAGLLWPCGPPLNPDGTCTTGGGTQVEPFIKGAIESGLWNGTALYDDLEVALTKRFSHGFQAEGSFTWGKNIDTGSATTIADPYTNSVSSMLWFCNSCRRGLADFNIARNLTINYIWDIPTPKSWGGVASHAFGGWEVGGIFTAHTGVPITPEIGPDPLGQNSNDPLAYPDRVPGCNPINTNFKNTPSLNYINLNCFTLPTSTPAIAAQCEPFGEPTAPVPGTCANLFGNAGRGTIIGPGLVNFDFSLFKNTYVRRISENFNVQFRAEFFNIFNRANFDTPFDNNVLFNPDGTTVGGAGTLDTMATTARQIQFGLKLIW